MTPDGHKTITRTLSATGIEAKVEPQPGPHEDVRFLEIITAPENGLAEVLNALGTLVVNTSNHSSNPALRWMENEVLPESPSGDDPYPGRPTASRYLTFEDMNVPVRLPSGSSIATIPRL